MLYQSSSVYIGLGSNLSNELGTPKDHLCNAAHALKTLGKLSASSLYRSPPMGPQDQPDFLNAVLALKPFADQSLTPQSLLKITQQLEKKANRKRTRHWGERSLDIDILIFGDHTLNTKHLKLPHPGIAYRDFVVVPLLELEPNLKLNDSPLSLLPIANAPHSLCIVDDHNWIHNQ